MCCLRYVDIGVGRTAFDCFVNTGLSSCPRPAKRGRQGQERILMNELSYNRHVDSLMNMGEEDTVDGLCHLHGHMWGRL